MRLWMFRLGAILVAPFIALMIVEIGARMLTAPAEAELLFNAPDNAPDGLYINDHRLGHIPTPGFEGTAVSPGYRVKLAVNSLGLRGPEPTEDTGTQRWLVGGDSFTFAAQVDHKDTFVAQLASDTRHTFNAGADGYGSWQIRLRYRELDEKLGIDALLLVFFTGNDLHDNANPERLIHEAQRLVHGAPKPKNFIPWHIRWLSRHSFVYVRYQIAQRTTMIGNGQDLETERWKREMEIFTQRGSGELNHLMQSTTSILRDLKRETDNRGDRLLVAVAPPVFAIDPTRRDAIFEMVGHDLQRLSPRAPTDAVVGALDRLGIPACDLHTPLEEGVLAGQSLYFDYDGHWNRRGHTVVTDAIEKCINR